MNSHITDSCHQERMDAAVGPHSAHSREEHPAQGAAQAAEQVLLAPHSQLARQQYTVKPYFCSIVIYSKGCNRMVPD
jgi:hypothetical protein